MFMVRTVAGLLDASTLLGPVLSHEHLRLDLCRRGDEGAVLDGRHAEHVVAELSSLREEFGLSLVVEQTCRGMGRDVAALVGLSAACGVAVVAATGWYHEAFHPAEVRGADADFLAEVLVREIEVGIGPRRIRPGLIGEVGTSGEEPSAAERRTFAAAARAAVRTGLSVATHAHLGCGGLVQLRLLTGQGLAPHRIAIGHQDLLDDPATHRRLAAEGAYVSFDTIGKYRYQDDDVRLRLLLALLEAGHADRLLLSCDVSRPAYLTSRGGMGYGHLLRTFLPRLRAAGVTDDLVQQMTRRNPLSFLTGASGEESSSESSGKSSGEPSGESGSEFSGESPRQSS
ncbi:putative phosphotriesterase [Streptomyces sp. NBRC 110611]|uniref:phosphotriesterase family protein n=1 Tax=Streptomyces sp. NBRC 110611 TaxID=1621259 RepID=UPI000837A060|nr:phosphotriesterase [Streptomyces sp. NBRC 110611]GAU65925.1 putative phosphotriesterase [Streptomyces sp. NBRC 110611]